MHRRSFVRQSAALAGGLAMNPWKQEVSETLEILNPRNRVPISFIIDDSTALVNLAHYGIPQFQEVFPDNYTQDWRKLPREIPDSFVNEFLDWCESHGVKGKYSMVPYPACTGWLNRFIPGWTTKELEKSIRLIREKAQPNWDIHPEMISHTRVIDIKTGLPYPDATPDYMENWEWSQNRPADELGEYLAYALQILKDTDLYCEGVTTPGGFASQNIPNLAKATQMAVGEVYGAEVAHYFRDLFTTLDHSVAPQVSDGRDLNGNNPSCSVHIIGCTGDWFGGWDGLTPGDPDRFITEDLSTGRMVDVIDSGEPAIMVCHWPGIYYNGDRLGFNIFKTVVNRLQEKYGHLNWMKLSEIARYWAAKEYTKVGTHPTRIEFSAPFATTDFTVRTSRTFRNVSLQNGDGEIPLIRVPTLDQLKSNSWYSDGRETWICFDLQRGKNVVSSGS